MKIMLPIFGVLMSRSMTRLVTAALEVSREADEQGAG